MLQSRCNLGLLFYNGSSPYCHAVSRKYPCFLQDCIFSSHAVQHLQYMKLKLGEFNKNFISQSYCTLLPNFKRQSLSWALLKFDKVLDEEECTEIKSSPK